MNNYLFILALWSCAALASGAVLQAQVTHQQRPEDPRTAEQYRADCAAGMSLSACGTIPISKDCEFGRHWSTAGLHYAHCVQNDMDCPVGTRLEHDGNGNPSCSAIVCPQDYRLVDGLCVPVAPPAPPVVALPVPGFNGMAYGTYSEPGNSIAALNVPSSSGFARMNIILNTGNGSWLFSSTAQTHPTGSNQPLTAPNSGIWTTNPATVYQYRISALVYGSYNPYFPVGQSYDVNDTVNYWTGVTPFPEAATDWMSLPANSLVSIGGINMDMRRSCSYVAYFNFPLSLQYTVQLRRASEPDVTSTATFDLVFHFSSLSYCGSQG